MKKYEIMFIVKPDLEETTITSVANSMKELLDDGVISKTLASDVITSLSEEEQKT